MDSIGINLDKVDLDINSIMLDIKSVFDAGASSTNVFMPEQSVSIKELESACKIFGCGSDK